MKPLNAWFRTALGEDLAQTECRLLSRRLAALHARRILQLGAYGAGQSPAVFGEARQWLLDDWHGGPVDVSGEAEQLPLQAETMDVVVVVHQLEFSPWPHQILREAVRVLAPEGHLLVVSFNPFSLWGLRRLLYGRGGQPPWSGRFLPPPRVADWMMLLGLTVERHEGIVLRPPLDSRWLLRRGNGPRRRDARLGPWLRWVGGVNLAIGKKRVAAVRPPRAVARPRLEVIPGGLAQTRVAHDSRSTLHDAG